MQKNLFDTIRRVIREAVGVAPPVELQQPPAYHRQAPARQYSRSVRGGGNFGSGGGAMRGGVQVQRAAPASGPTARMAGPGGTMKVSSTNVGARAAPPAPPSGRLAPTGGGSMQGTPKVSGGSMNTTEFKGRNMGANLSDKLDDVSRKMPKGFVPKGVEAAATKAAPALAKGLGTAARIAGGPVATAAMAVMEPTPAGEKMSEFKRQETLKSYNPFKPQGRSISKIEADLAPKNEPKVSAPKTTITADPPKKISGYTSHSQIGDTSIKSGDTLSNIAKTKNTSVSDIMTKNPSILDPNKVLAGTKIFTGDAPTPPKRPEMESGKKKGKY